MLKLVLYTMPKSGRWRWKLMRADKCLARADYHWANKSAAKTAFNGLVKNIQKLEGKPVAIAE